MQEVFERSYCARGIVVLASSAVVLTLVHAAVARDNGGVMQFFNNPGPPQTETPTYQAMPSAPVAIRTPIARMARERPLTVHVARHQPLKPHVVVASRPPWKAAPLRAEPAIARSAPLRAGPAIARSAPLRAGPAMVRSVPPTPPIFDFAGASQDKPVLISLLQDRTLRRGDAVMTYAGIQIFAGSKVWPFTPHDFMALAAAKSMDLHFRKTLAEIDKLPRDYPPGLDQFAIRSNLSTQ